MSKHEPLTEAQLAEFQRRTRISKSKTGKGGVGGGALSATRLACRQRHDVAGNSREPVPNPAPSPTFVVHGAAMGKPRMTQRDKWAQRPCVLRYRAWCDAVRAAAGIQEPMTLTQAVRLSAVFYLPCHHSWSTSHHEQMRGAPHVYKPDVDNLVKSIMDALFVNDAFVYSVDAKKYWDDGVGPRVVVRIKEEQP